MDAAVAGTFSAFRPTRSYTNPRDVTRRSPSGTVAMDDGELERHPPRVPLRASCGTQSLPCDVHVLRYWLSAGTGLCGSPRLASQRPRFACATTSSNAC
jgi:hypothetical protein